VGARTFWESVKVEGETIVERVKEIVREGNVRRIVVEHEGRTIAEFPLTAGVVGAVLAPVAAAVGALVALLKDCTIRVEREEPTATREEHADTAAR
jgi:DNA-binding Lrp family transcriptional regulator